MKKYLKSGFNTTQDIKLEAGTYSLVAYVKSLYGNTYTFALGYDGAQGVEWTEYDVDVVKNQLCKVWFTFTITEKITKLKPISSNFSASLPVYVADLQLTRGNVPVESGASPFDFDEIINDLHDEIDAIEDFTEGAFKDGLLNDVEKMQLRASLDAVGVIVESVRGSYDKLKVNPFINQDRMADINRTYNDFMVAWINPNFDPKNPYDVTNKGGLKDIILWIVEGNHIVEGNERAEKDRALEAFNSALYAYNMAEKEVYKDIGDEIEGVQAEIDEAKDSVTDLGTEIGKAFSDSSITNIEANNLELLRKRLVKEVADVVAVATSIDISVADVNSKMSVLNSLIGTYANKADSFYPKTVTVAERNAITTAFENVETSLATLYTAIENKKINSSITNFTNTVIKDVQEQIDGKIETWFQTTNPATAWTTADLKTKHVGDMWYNTTTKELKRYSGTAWGLVEDKKAIDAFTKASTAQDTADGKRRVFTETPYTPYEVGDLWVGGTSNDLMRCKTTRLTGTYVASEWIKAVKYTDDTKANEAKQGVTDLGEEIKTAFSDESITNIEANNLDLLRKNLAKEVADVVTIATSISVSVVDINAKMSALNTEIGKYVGKSKYPIAVTVANRNAINTAFANLEASLVALYDAIDNKKINNSLANFEDVVIAGVQDQIDGKIETWFQSSSPSTAWTTTALKNKHKGDMWYNTTTNNKELRRWSGTAWELIEDKKAIDAFNKASDAQDTADGKRDIWVTQPKPPYKVGDLWSQGANGDLMRCKTPRPSGSYVASDWEKASKYTDDTKADEAKAAANTALAKTKFMTEIDGGLIYSAMMKLYDAGGTGDEMAGISGIAGDNKEDPAFWAGGTYEQAIGGTAKAIIRHDGSSKFTDTDITGKITATSGSFKGRIESDEGNLGGMEISGDMLVSQNGRVVIDGKNEAIYLLDENGSTKTVIKSTNLPSLSSYFSNAFSQAVSMSPLSNQLTESYPTVQTSSISIPEGSYEAVIPQVTMTVYANSTSELGGGASARLELVYGGKTLTIGTVSAWASGHFGIDSQILVIPAKTVPFVGGGNARLRVILTNDSIGGSSVIASASVSTSGNFGINGIVNRSEIGNNGMMIATSKTNYDYMVGDTHEVRRGQTIFRVTNAGVRKSTNGGSNWDDI